MPTALAATYQPGNVLYPARNLLQVTGAPTLSPVYTGVFTATVDGWTGSGGTTLTFGTTLDGSGVTGDALELKGVANTTAVQTFSRTVTGLVIGSKYRLSMDARRFGSNCWGTLALSVSGMTPGAYVSVNGGNVYYEFTATATSHVIQVLAQTGPNVPVWEKAAGYAGARIRNVKVTRLTGWLGTTITRTDANGTATVRESAAGQDATGTTGSGVMTVYDYEAALVGVVCYTVTDGNGATATTAVGELRRNLAPDPTAAGPVAGWLSDGAVSTSYHDAQAWKRTTGTYLYAAAPAKGSRFYAARVRLSGTPGTAYTVTSSDNVVGPVTGSASGTIPAGGVVDVALSSTTATAPATVQVNVGLSVPAGVDITAVLIEEVSATATAAGAWFAGSSPDTTTLVHGWAGTVNASASVQASALTAPGVWLSLPASTTNLASPETPPAFVPLALVTGYDQENASNGVVHTIVGRADPIANPGPLALGAGQLQVWCADYADAARLRDLLAAGDVALMRQPDHRGMDLYLVGQAVGITPDDEDTSPQRWAVALRYQEVAAT